MSYHTEKPTVTEGDGIRGEQTFDHPAFGSLSVTRISSTGTELFNSALNHQHFMAVKVSRASLCRSLHNDRIYSRLDDVITEFYLSEAQWATFVAGGANGMATPCTFGTYREGNIKHVPGIESIETVKETFEREIREKTARDVKEAKDIAVDLEKLIEEGKLGKTQMREILGRLKVFSGNFSTNMAFTQEMFAETMEKNIEQGKSEFEAFVNSRAQALGLQQLQQEAATLRLEQKKDKTND